MQVRQRIWADVMSIEGVARWPSGSPRGVYARNVDTSTAIGCGSRTPNRCGTEWEVSTGGVSLWANIAMQPLEYPPREPRMKPNPEAQFEVIRICTGCSHEWGQT